ncbi:hypothetical protein BJ170DRAFT_461450 [Xylariales sp. AK1849]|nr:hypothetical protein BJ170DRAFT_461450 [Xylariales sp. AK1849]
MATDEAMSSASMGGSGPAQSDQPHVPGAASSPAPSSTGSQSRPHYTPQFSAATEMILKRIRGEPSNMSSAISSASAAGVIKQSTYEDAKRRLVMSMNTSLTLPMPASVPAVPVSMLGPPPAASASLYRNNTYQPRGPPAPKPTPTRGRPRKSEKKGKAPQGTKRKRGKDEDDNSSPLSDPPESDEDDEYQDASAPTMTKSGRQILKPTQFNPTTASGPGKRKHYGKRTPEQALCKVCTRGLSPANNQIVFCDGCNFCWHQMCHDPYIDDEFVSDESRSWFCQGCLAKREKHLAKKKSMSAFKGVSWSTKSAEQRRTYMSGLSQAQLVNLVMYSLELHPDLAIFPADTNKRGPRGGASAVSVVEESFHLLEAAGGGPVNFSSSLTTPEARSSSSNGKRHSNGKEATNGQEQGEREDSAESVPPAWPKVGQGVLAGLDLNEDDLQDKNDFESFSVATYDATGKKVLENGMTVSNHESGD